MFIVLFLEWPDDGEYSLKLVATPQHKPKKVFNVD